MAEQAKAPETKARPAGINYQARGHTQLGLAPSADKQKKESSKEGKTEIIRKAKAEAAKK